MDSKTLALYLGCPVMAVTSKLGEHKRKLVGVYDDGEVQSAKLWFAGGISDWDIEDFKLLLRPLSSMTEEDVKELSGYNVFKDQREFVRFKEFNDCKAIYYRWRNENKNLNTDDGFCYSSNAVYFDKEEWTPKNFQYLLSKGFDLFSLIEKGEAIEHVSETLRR